MPRAMWSGVIGFGMVSIPIKLYAATENRNVSFHQLHAVCQTRIKEVRWCPTCDREVPWEEVQKGFEYSKGDYVMLDDEDLRKLPPVRRLRKPAPNQSLRNVQLEMKL